jgi:hypothetical protein
MNLPAWVTNPKTQVLLVPTGSFRDGYKNLVLVNAMTTERFDIPFFPESIDFFWMPNGSQFGILSRLEDQVTLVSIQDGNITHTTVPQSATRFVVAQSFRGPPYPIQASSSDLEDPKFLFLPSWMKLSPARNYFLYQEDYDSMYTSIFEISTGQTVIITDPNDEYFDLSSEWSPDSRYLAVAQADEEPGMLYQFENPPLFRLRVYDIASRQMVASYRNVTFPNWSPDGLKFLFQEWQDWFGESSPCIFDTISGTTKCYYDAVIQHKKTDTFHTTFSSVQWSPDQTMIGYIYFSFDQETNDEYGGFCTITLASGDSRCMLEKFEMEEQTIIDYSWSPDSSFISFEYDTTSPYSDDHSQPQLGIANVKTGEYFTIGDHVNRFQLGLWRPPIDP